MKIAFVDDDHDAREIFTKRLRAEGHLCESFEKAEQLLTHVAPGLYDVVVTDQRLPGMTGIKLINQLRARNILTPCILITAFNSVECARDALNANANFLLEKPFRYDALIRSIKKVTEHHLTVQHCVERGLSALTLTQRENEVAKLILKGLSNADISRVMNLSEKTVKQYVTQIFQKAKVTSRAEFFSSIFPV